MNNCIYLKRKSKKGQYFLYCSEKKEKITFENCKNCEFREYKVKIRKPMNKINKKRKTVSQKTYQEVFDRCNGRCAICGTTKNLSYHHIKYRSERPDLIDEPDNGIMLCDEFANNCHKGKAHKNKKYWQPILLEIAEKSKNKKE